MYRLIIFRLKDFSASITFAVFSLKVQGSTKTEDFEKRATKNTFNTDSRYGKDIPTPDF